MNQDGAEVDEESLIADFLARSERPAREEIEAFISTAPVQLRDSLRRHIATVSRIRETLSRVDSRERAGEAQPPQIPGFRLGAKLGEGGLGAVYEAWDESLERKVAIKVLKQSTPEVARERILAEARKAAGFQHPAIVTVHSVTVGGSAPGIVMEKIDGAPLDRAAAHLGWRKKARLLRAMATGLAAAHARGIVHRDLKPENVLVTAELEPKILDFGLALGSDAAGRQRGIFAGTPQYASPEQARGDALTPASDVFSFGIMLFEVLTGRRPFEGGDALEVLRRIEAAEAPFPRSLSDDVPEDLQAICLACLAREPASRPSSLEVAADLGRYLAGEPVRLRPALYGDILRKKIAGHLGDLREWRIQGMVSEVESDRLLGVYRRILADEDHWILDARKLSLIQTVTYTGTWMAVVATMFFVWLARNDLSPLSRWLVPLCCTGLLLAVGLWAHARREILAAAAFLAGAILASGPTALSLLVELGISASPAPGVPQLLQPPFTNSQLLASTLVALGLSLFAFRYLRMTGFAWTTALLVTATYASWLLTLGLLERPPEQQALWALPLVLLEAFALLFEARRRTRWAFPFHWIALIALVAGLDVMAAHGPTLVMLGIEPANAKVDPDAYFSRERLASFSYALNGLVFLAIMILTERAPSLDLRRASRLLEVLVPVHLLGSLYFNAVSHRHAARVGVDVALYASAVVAILILGPWRSRMRFLIGGLAGVALGSYLVIDLGLVAKVPFILGLGALGLVTAIASAVFVGASRKK